MSTTKYEPDLQENFTSRRIPPQRNPIIITNEDGRPEVFMIGEDYKVRHKWLLSTNGDWLNPNDWSEWSCLGNEAVAILGVAKNANGRLEIFGQDPDNYTIKHKFQSEPNGGWTSEWSSLGGEYADFRVEINQDGRIELFGISVWGAHLHHNYQTAPNGGWSGWSALDEGISVTNITVSKNVDGRIEVFGRNPDDRALYHIWQQTEGGWSKWGALKGITLVRDNYVNTVAVGANADGRLEVYAIDEKLTLKKNWQTTPNGPWSGWSELDINCSRIYVARNVNGCLELFANKNENGGGHKQQTAPNNGWSDWKSMNRSFSFFGVGNDAAGHHIVIDGYRSHFGPTSTESETRDILDPEFGFVR